MPQLVQRLYRLYGSRWDFYLVLQRVTDIMENAAASRTKWLCIQDEENENTPDWFLNEKETGLMLYVDLFSGDIAGLKKHIPFLTELGITYVHLMPLFQSPKDHNDGGYAVSSYRKVDAKLGTMEQLADLASAFHANGIRLVLDFVFNHTSDEHVWALAAKEGDKKFRDFYFIFEEKSEADAWNATLREIFPNTRRGSFTFVPDAGGWVWTTFHSYQWDLNYGNPDVFLAMCEEMLAIANLGVDVLRLDALAFIWKKIGTVCENLPEAHMLIQAFQFVAQIVCPSLVFKSEAIVHPDEVVKYIGTDECRLSYNPLQMALFWESIATRSTRLLTHSLQKRWNIPDGCGWVNYLRCHDDIGWTFSDEDASECGINGYDHRRFLNQFYTNRFEGSFARGEFFQYNPSTGDCRICGTLASLAGLEDAYSRYCSATSSADQQQAILYGDMAVRRITMFFAVLFALPGVPLLYAGDETATLNDYRYRTDPQKQADSRWVHRIATDWTRIRKITAPKKPVTENTSHSPTPETWLLARQSRVFHALKKIVSIRKDEPLFGKTNIRFHEEQNEHLFAFSRYHNFSEHDGAVPNSGPLHVIANFSEETCVYYFRREISGTDLLTGETYLNTHCFQLGPYATLWFKET